MLVEVKSQDSESINFFNKRDAAAEAVNEFWNKYQMYGLFLSLH